MSKQDNILFIVTSSYPYGIYETFLESEIIFLNEAFDKIIIFTLDNKSPNTTNRLNDKNINVYRIKPKSRLNNLMLLFRSVFSLELIKDIFYLTKRNVSMYRVLKIVLRSHSNSGNIKNQLKLIVKQYPSFSNYYFYSYWLDDSAIAITDLAKNINNMHSLSRAHGWDVYFERSEYGVLPMRKFIILNIYRFFLFVRNYILQ